MNTCPACGSRASDPHCPSSTCKWRRCVCERTYDPQTGRHMLSNFKPDDR